MRRLSVTCHIQNTAMPQKNASVKKITVLESISVPSGVVNDDRAGHRESCIWVIDGATDCNREKYLPGGSDAAWLAGQFHENLLAKAPSGHLPLEELIASITEAVHARFQNEKLRDLEDRGHQPSAAALIARLADGVLEVLGFGDCQLFVALPGKRAELRGVDRARLGDFASIERIKRAAKEHGLDWQAARAKVQGSGAVSRRKMNLPGGYSVLSIDMAPLDLIHREAIPLEPGARLLFATDGFTRLSEVFNVYSEETLLQAAFEKGLAALIAELRGLERKDERCETYPRVKVLDDATAILAVAE